MVRALCIVVIVSGLVLTRSASAAEKGHSTFDSAPVEVDGERLFDVRGIAALPASQRAKDIADRIATLAADPAFRLEDLHHEDRGDVTTILGGTLAIVHVTDEDCRLVGVQRSLIAPTYTERIRRAIVEHREARSRARLTASAGRALTAVAIAAASLVLLLWLLGKAEVALHRAFDRRTSVLAANQRGPRTSAASGRRCAARSAWSA
jgi:hypothetical protein